MPTPNKDDKLSTLRKNAKKTAYGRFSRSPQGYTFVLKPDYTKEAGAFARAMPDSDKLLSPSSCIFHSPGHSTLTTTTTRKRKLKRVNDSHDPRPSYQGLERQILLFAPASQRNKARKVVPNALTPIRQTDIDSVNEKCTPAKSSSKCVAGIIDLSTSPKSHLRKRQVTQNRVMRVKASNAQTLRVLDQRMKSGQLSSLPSSKRALKQHEHCHLSRYSNLKYATDYYRLDSHSGQFEVAPDFHPQSKENLAINHKTLNSRMMLYEGVIDVLVRVLRDKLSQTLGDDTKTQASSQLQVNTGVAQLDSAVTALCQGLPSDKLAFIDYTALVPMDSGEYSHISDQVMCLIVYNNHVFTWHYDPRALNRPTCEDWEVLYNFLSPAVQMMLCAPDEQSEAAIAKQLCF